MKKPKFIRKTFWLFSFSIFYLITFNSLYSYAKDVDFEMSVDSSNISLGQATELSLAFSDTQDIPKMELSGMDGFQARYLGPSTRMSIVNGHASNSITHIYTLIPLKVGTFKIGPLKFDHKGNTYTSNSISINVSQGGQSAPAAPAGQSNEENSKDNLNLGDRVFLVMQVAQLKSGGAASDSRSRKSQFYVNEIIPVTIKMYVNKLGIRDIQLPELNAEGFSVYEQFGQPKQYEENLNGVNYEVIEFNTSIFGLRATSEEFKLGPANLKCNLIVRKENRKRGSDFDDVFGADVFENFFGRYETYPLNLKSLAVPITILALPEENKPVNFDGTVGDFDLEVTANPAEVKAGDPITLKMAVNGDGNFNTMGTPKLKSSEGFKVYEPQVKQESHKKNFEQIIMPLKPEILEIPEVVFSFFNTRTAQYSVLTKGPLPIKVLKPEKEEIAKIVETASSVVPAVALSEEKLGRDIIYIKASSGKLAPKRDFLYKNKIFILLQFLPFLAFIICYCFYRINLKLKTDVRYARQLRASSKIKVNLRRVENNLLKGDVKEFYDSIFGTVQEYFGDRFHVPTSGVTLSVAEEILKNRDIDKEILAKVKDIFTACDMARYAFESLNKDDMSLVLSKLKEVVNYFERQKG